MILFAFGIIGLGFTIFGFGFFLGPRYALNERIDTTFRIDLAYESDPPQGNEKTDTTYSLGVGVKF